MAFLWGTAAFCPSHPSEFGLLRQSLVHTITGNKAFLLNARHY